MVAAAPLAAVESQQHLQNGELYYNAHLQQEGDARGSRPHFHQERVLWPRRTRNIRRAQVLKSLSVAHPETCQNQAYIPAPRTTLESPFQSDLKPSTLETVTRALAMELVYVAVGPGLMTCIRVYLAVSMTSNILSQVWLKSRTLSMSTGYMTECS